MPMHKYFEEFEERRTGSQEDEGSTRWGLNKNWEEQRLGRTQRCIEWKHCADEMLKENESKSKASNRV